MAFKASLHSLPTETKTRIAELCHLQDKAIQRVFYLLDCAAREPSLPRSGYNTYHTETDVFKRGPFTDGRYEDSDYPKSLLSLSSVSREWRDIALKILLKKVTACQCSEVFLFGLAPRYGHLVEELELGYWSDSCSAVNILSSLPHMSKVRNITLPPVGRFCKELVRQARTSKFPVEFASRANIASALRRVSQQAETVALCTDGLEDMIPIIRGAGLTKLKLSPSSGDLPTVFSAALACPNLRTLAIWPNFRDLQVFKDAAALPDLHHPTLRRLEICDLYGCEGLYTFIQHFSSTLEELDLDLGTKALGDLEPSDLRHLNLPQLQQLDVTADIQRLAPLARHISPSTFPALRTCTWYLRESNRPKDPTGNATEGVDAAVDAIDQMRDQQADRAAPLRLSLNLNNVPDMEALQPALEASGITIGTEQGGVVVDFEPPSPEESEPRDPPDLILTPKLYRKDNRRVKELGEIVSGSLDRIRDLKDHAVAVGNQVQITRIAQALQEGEWLCVEKQC